MRNPLRILLVVAVLAAIGGMGALAWQPMLKAWKEKTRIKYRTAEATRGKLVYVINSSGTVKPVLSVQIGSFVSGPIIELHADHNDHVKKDALLARIDPRIYAANVARDTATLATATADVHRMEALVQQAVNNEIRAKALQTRNADFISKQEMDQYKFNLLSLRAQLELSKASVQQAEANLSNSQANLNYTYIRAPVDGIVIDKKIEPGQTLAVSFQMPELFVIAPDMDKMMHVYANVDEADIGLIRTAQERGNPVHFTVSAYPDDAFEGKIHQVRKSPTTTNNVVTYTVVVEASNPEMKLMPGMTANLSFQVESRGSAVRIPNDALRFFPPDRKQVREADRKLLDGVKRDDQDEDAPEAPLPAEEKAEANRRRNRRHVWIEENYQLRALEIVVGISDHKNTELVSGDLKVGQKLVTGIEPKTLTGS